MQPKLNHPGPAASIRSELQMTQAWDTAGIRSLLVSKSAAGRKPAFLFLGRREADLLRTHLGAAFGPESVQTLKNLYYMGLEVIELDTPAFLRTAGLKRVREFRDRRGRAPRWNDIEAGSVWHFDAL
ncbi:MAG: hypothetical protein HKN82_12885 [Akkermansiaceae bacterium]|nr:hypothetical protein [Akkermansiaceae bacterium]NNM30737.1 hypothetical protein [Akkermansiaceae bacterium]